jgi:hypothetical protein
MEAMARLIEAPRSPAVAGFPLRFNRLRGMRSLSIFKRRSGIERKRINRFLIIKILMDYIGNMRRVVNDHLWGTHYTYPPPFPKG